MMTLIGSIRCIKELDIYGNRIGDSGAMLVAMELADNQCLKNLRLVNNDIKLHGATELADALAKNKRLEKLDLSYNFIGVEGARALGSVLAKNQYLKELALCHNKVGYGGAVAMARALSMNNILEILDLSDNEVDNFGAIEIANALQNHTSLMELNLGWNDIGDIGAIGLAEMLRSNSVLKYLHLWQNNSMGEKGRKSLGCAMPHNRVLESLRLQDGPPECPWSRNVEFFTGCNKVHLWNLILDKNVMIPWNKAMHILLREDGNVHPWNRLRDMQLDKVYRKTMLQSFRLSMVFLLLQNRPDIVCGDDGREK
mmetsp:Transcript_25575/g.59400  ORF Transcript_25575/g.59400 Transcript_25575/m.59400 type:complete len:312 (-) Transcript_25575:96-1031(-)